MKDKFYGIGKSILLLGIGYQIGILVLQLIYKKTAMPMMNTTTEAKKAFVEEEDEEEEDEKDI